MLTGTKYVSTLLTMPALDRRSALKRYYEKNKKRIASQRHFQRTGCRCGFRFGVICEVKKRQFASKLKRQKAYNAIFYGKRIKSQSCPVCRRPTVEVNSVVHYK